MSFEDENDFNPEDIYLPEIGGVFGYGIVGSAPYVSHPSGYGQYPQDYGIHTTLPDIPEYFQDGFVSASVPRAHIPDLPSIPGYYERGVISEWVPFARESLDDSQSELPYIDGSFGNGIVSESVPRISTSELQPDTTIRDTLLGSESDVPPVGTPFDTSLVSSSIWSEPLVESSEMWSTPSISALRHSGSESIESPLSFGFDSLLLSNTSTPSPVLGPTPVSRFSRWSQNLTEPLKLDDWAQSILGPSFSGGGFGSLTSVPQLTDEQKYEKSSTIEEDIELMAQKGFVITERGAMFRGYYGNEIQNQIDMRGQPFGVGEVGQPFVVKWFECKENDSMSDMKREMFEIERYILGSTGHQNIVSLRYIFTMGRHKQCKYRNNPDMTFSSWDRQYMILEFAEFGDLESFLEENVLTEVMCVTIIRDLFSGLKHLHDRHIYHNDIEPRNVLLFQRDGQLVAKWCDFGMASVLDGTHPSQPISMQSRSIDCIRYDLDALAKIFQMVLMCSQIDSQWSQYIEQIIERLTQINDLNQIQSMFDY